MNDLMKENPDLAQKLISEIETANRMESGQDLQKAISTYLAIWNALPNPKENWELFSGWLSDCLVSCYLKTNELDNAKKWAIQSHTSRASDIETSSLVQLGYVYLRLNDENNAFKWFDEAYKIGKQRAFQDFPIDCLEFYLKHKKSCSRVQ